MGSLLGDCREQPGRLGYPSPWFQFDYCALLRSRSALVRQKILFVQKLDRYRTVCLLLTELLPIMGLLGTVPALMNTFKSFQTAPGGDAPGLTIMIRIFAPALSTTVSGLFFICPNLILNGVMWLPCPTTLPV
ncbi:MAG: MotA/TolQ/ExbB proton channel family protein [Thermoguttaceae bacterium]